MSILDKLIEKARELAAEVKERAVTLARNVADRVDSLFRRPEEQNTERARSSNRRDLRPFRSKSSSTEIWPASTSAWYLKSHSTSSSPTSTSAWMLRPVSDGKGAEPGAGDRPGATGERKGPGAGTGD